jgi:4-hydroxy-2-oxoheptanedioate aldolase
LAKGLHPRVELADIDLAAPYLEMGVRHFCIGWDVRTLYNWWRVNGEGMRTMLDAGTSATRSEAKARQPAGTY